MQLNAQAKFFALTAFSAFNLFVVVILIEIEVAFEMHFRNRPMGDAVGMKRHACLSESLTLFRL